VGSNLVSHGFEQGALASSASVRPLVLAAAGESSRPGLTSISNVPLMRFPSVSTMPTSQMRSPNQGERPVVSKSRKAKRQLVRSNMARFYPLPPEARAFGQGLPIVFADFSTHFLAEEKCGQFDRLFDGLEKIIGAHPTALETGFRQPVEIRLRCSGGLGFSVPVPSDSIRMTIPPGLKMRSISLYPSRSADFQSPHPRQPDNRNSSRDHKIGAGVLDRNVAMIGHTGLPITEARLAQ